jgi:hypothetical protein
MVRILRCSKCELLHDVGSTSLFIYLSHGPLKALASFTTDAQSVLSFAFRRHVCTVSSRKSLRRGADKSLAFPICSTTKRILLGWVKKVRTTKS